MKHLFGMGCQLVILACNTASAKALRTIQQRNLPLIDPTRRVLGVIRPTVEAVCDITQSGHIGVFGTPGTIQSESYNIEIAHLYPQFQVYGHACPMWVPLVENCESDGPGADYFVKKDIDALLAQCDLIDTVILGCTHYPLLIDKIRHYMPSNIHIVEQGPIVGASLADYLRRHPEMEQRCSHGGTCQYLTTDDAEKFSQMASIFVNEPVTASRVTILPSYHSATPPPPRWRFCPLNYWGFEMSVFLRNITLFTYRILISPVSHTMTILHNTSRIVKRTMWVVECCMEKLVECHFP